MRHNGDDCGGSRKGIVRAAFGRKTDGGTDSDISRKGGCLSRDVFFLWPVSRCGSGDYGKCVPLMGSTRMQDVAEG